MKQEEIEGLLNTHKVYKVQKDKAKHKHQWKNTNIGLGKEEHCLVCNRMRIEMTPFLGGRKWMLLVPEEMQPNLEKKRMQFN